MGESRSLGSLIVRLAAEGLGTYKADMNAAADATGKAGRAADVLGGSLNSLTKPVTAAESSMQALASNGTMVAGAFVAISAAALAFAAIGVGKVLSTIVMDSARAAAGLHDLSISTGAAVESLAAFSTLGKTSDTSIEKITGSMNRMANALRTVNDDSHGAGVALTALGIDVQSFKALRPDEQMKSVAAAMEHFADGSGKAAAAAMLFGKGGATMLPFMSDLASAGEQMAKVTDAQAIAADNFTDNLKLMQISLSEAKHELAMGMMPALDTVSQAFLDAINETGGFRDQIRQLAADGSLKQWTLSAASGLTYLIDAIAGLPLAFSQAQTSLAVVMKDIATAVEVAVTAAGAGFTQEGRDHIRQVLQERNAFVIAANEDSLANLERSLPGKRIRDAISRLETPAGASQTAKPNVILANPDDANSAAKVSKYEKLMESIRAKTALQVLELEQSDKLNDADKLKIDLYTKIDAGLLKLTTTQRLALDAALDVYDTEIKAVDLKKRLEKGNLDAGEAHAKYITSLSDGLENMKADSLAQKEANERLGLNKVAIAELDAAKLESQAVTLDLLAIKMLDKNLDEAQYNLYKAQSAELRSLADLKVRGSVNEAGIEAAKATEEANRKAASESEKYWEDALTRAFESGKNAFEAMWSTVKNTFQSQALKVFVQPVAASLGLSGAATAGPVSSGLSGFLGSATGGVTDLLGSSSMGALDIAGFSMPQIGLALAGLAVLKNLGVFGSNFVSAADSGRARVDYSAAGLGGAAYGTTGDAGQIGTATTNVNSLAKSYFDTAKALGITAKGASFEYGTNTGQEGANPMTVLGVNAGSASYSSGEIASGNGAALQLAASRAVLTALQASEIPNYLKHVFSGITAGTATQDQISNALAYAGSLKAIRTAMAETRTPMQVLKDTVTTGFAELGTSADTFKTDFVAAIDAGIGADKLAQWQALGSALDNLGTSASQQASAIEAAADNIRKLVSGISTSVSDSIFGMQYGLESNSGRYNMLDVRGARIDGQMRASTDIADIAKLAADQIALLNQAWALMDTNQQKVQLVAFEDKLTAIDDFVKEKGADPVALARAQAKEAADLMAATLKTVLLEALAAPAAAIDSAAASIQAAADTPAVANITVSVSAPKGQEVNIT